ncbi:hypothetical protein EH230_09405 [Flavobacterium columnare]|uniref:Uncharacterized protein n=1 Tax=Flavobacterium columnare TaxID=996 RepID=A0A437UBW1_9FLAO|nr:hypothetical protein [Flavobacterium columnare]RVU91097.1 hypothetical protein EH230_09405 [Flavobacterium columnare]
MKDLKIIFTDKSHISFYPPMRFYEYHIECLENLDKEFIKKMITKEEPFFLNVDFLSDLKASIENRIDYLVQHPDFDPFKKELLKRDKEEYGNYPFEWKSVQYYLYPRMGFEIDREIDKCYLLNKLLENQINANKPLEFMFEKMNTKS